MVRQELPTFAWSGPNEHFFCLRTAHLTSSPTAVCALLPDVQPDFCTLCRWKHRMPQHRRPGVTCCKTRWPLPPPPPAMAMAQPFCRMTVRCLRRRRHR